MVPIWDMKTYEVWKCFISDGSSKLDLKKQGDQVVDLVDGWLQSQESQVDAALKAPGHGAMVRTMGLRRRFEYE